MQYLEIIKLIISLLPLLIQAIQTVENVFPGSAQGSLKLDLVKSTLQTGYTAANDTTIKFEQAWPTIQTTIGNIVSAFNAVGLFKK